jgi:hypothetical protein
VVTHCPAFCQSGPIFFEHAPETRQLESMRAKVLVTASVLALAVLLPALYFHFKPESPPPAAEPVASDDTAPPAGLPPILKRVQSRPQEGLPARPANPAHLSANDHADYIIERRAELAELGMTDDPANLKTILSEMENPEPEIRKAALSATIQFGSQDAIPALQNEMNWATDPEEKVAIKKAIEFLQLPSFGSGGDAMTQQSSDGSAPPAN